MTHPNRFERRSPSRLLALLVIATIAVIAWLGWSVHHSYQTMTVAEQRTLKTERLRGIITHLDELLTMSARMAAASGERRWEERYLAFEPELDAAINEALELATGLHSPGMAALTYEANKRLVAMEKRAFDLVRQGNREAARTLLLSPEYEREKERYSRGVAEFGAALEAATVGMTRSARRSMVLRLGLVSVVLLTLMGTWGWVLRILHRWQVDLVSNHEQLSRQTALLDGINKVLQAAITCDTEQAVARTCLGVARNLTSSRYGVIGEVDVAGRFGILVRDNGVTPPASDSGPALPDSELDDAVSRLWSHIASTGQVQCLPVLTGAAPRSAGAETSVSRGSWLGVPLKRRGETVGLIALADSPVNYPVAVRRDVEALSVAFVEALGSKRNEEDLRRHREHLQELVRERTEKLEEANAHLERQVQEKRLAEAALVNERNLLRAVIDNLPIYIFVKDRQSRFLVNNQAHLRILGARSQEEVIGKTDFDIFPPVVAAKYYADEQSLLRSGRPLVNAEETTVDPEGRERWLITDKVPFWDSSGEIVGLVGMSHDITERKLAEDELRRMTLELRAAKGEAEAANQAKSQFLANMSHEIRTPMSAVIGMSDLLLDTELTEEQRDCAETIHQSAETLLAILNDILDFSKIEAGKMALESIPFDWRRCVENAVDVFAAGAAEKGLELTLLLAPDLPATVLGDPGRLRQILLNLISNAVKFTDQGEVIVTVAADREADRDDEVALRFEVRDTGPGMLEEDRDRLFQAFVQADTSTTRRHGGTGLGLAICQRLVSLMGGKLTLESRSGFGTTIRFGVVFQRAEAATERGEALQSVDLRGLPVVVIDDNATNRQVVRTYLAHWGCTVEEVAVPEEAVPTLRAAAARGQPFRVALIDLQMPGLDGEHLGWAIRQERDLEATQLILLTSVTHRNPSAELLKIGFGGYLVKPVKASALFDCLRMVLGRSQVPALRRPPTLVTEALLDRTSRRPARLLIAEDSEANQKLIRRVLERAGYECDVVSNGKQALAALDQHGYDLVLMDCQMPVLDGYAATREIRRREAGREHTVIVALTASVMKGDRELCLEAGMDDYTTKPIVRDGLLSVIARWTQGSAGGRQSVDTPGGSPVRSAGVRTGEALSGLPSGQSRGSTSADRSVVQDGAGGEVPDVGQTGKPRVDLVALGDLVGGDAGVLEDLVRTFVIENLSRLKALRQALRDSDAVAVRQLAHGIKSAALNLKAPVLSALALEIEALGQRNDLDPVPRLYGQLVRELAKVRRFLRSALRRRGPSAA